MSKSKNLDSNDRFPWTYIVWSMSVSVVDTPAGQFAGRLLQWQHQSLVCAWGGTTPWSSTTYLHINIQTHRYTFNEQFQEYKAGFGNISTTSPSVPLITSCHNWIEVQVLFLSNQISASLPQCLIAVEEELSFGDRLSNILPTLQW